MDRLTGRLTDPGPFARKRRSPRFVGTHLVNPGNFVANKYTRKGKQGSPLGEDEFVSFWNRAYEASLPYARHIAIGLAGLVVVAVLAWVGLWVRSNARQDATEAFGLAAQLYDAELKTADKDAKAADKAPALADSDGVKQYATAKERAEAVLAELDKVKGSAVAKSARLARAGVLYDLGRYAEAEPLYRAVADDTEGLVRDVAAEGVGLCLENQGKLDDALKAYQALAARDGLLKDRAGFDQARVMAQKGDKDGAVKLLKEVLGRIPTGQLHDQLQTQLAQLEG